EESSQGDDEVRGPHRRDAAVHRVVRQHGHVDDWPGGHRDPGASVPTRGGAHHWLRVRGDQYWRHQSAGLYRPGCRGWGRPNVRIMEGSSRTRRMTLAETQPWTTRVK